MPGAYQLTASAVCGGQFVQTLLHFELSEGGTADTFTWADACANKWESTFLASWLAMLGSDYIYSSTRCKKVSGSGGPTAIVLGNAGATGTFGPPTNDTSVSGLIEFPVNLAGKNVTGKVFVPLPDTAFVSNGIEPTTYLPLMQTMGTLLLTSQTLSGSLGTMKFCIFNRATKVDVIPQHFRIGALLGTQRRRLHPV